MGVALKKQKIHPHVFRQKGVCGGRDTVAGTRIPIWSIIKWYKLGLTVEEVMREFPQLTPSQVHDAFSYYYDNPEEIEKDIQENENESFLREGLN
jgi:type III restriction enzyme